MDSGNYSYDIDFDNKKSDRSRWYYDSVRGRDIADLFTKRNHHRNLSVIYTVQNNNNNNNN